MRRKLAFLIGGVLCALTLLAWCGERPRLLAAGGPDESASDATPKLKLRREGTQLQDEPGRFVVSGSQATFVAADGASYIGLPNLNLERVEKITASSPGSGEWLVTGIVTEYQGANYLLISRARRKAPTKSQRSF